MKLEYFKETDTLYFDVQEKVSTTSKDIGNGILLDYDESGNIVGIEIDNASKVANLAKFETV